MTLRKYKIWYDSRRFEDPSVGILIPVEDIIKKVSFAATIAIKFPEMKNTPENIAKIEELMKELKDESISDIIYILNERGIEAEQCDDSEELTDMLCYDEGVVFSLNECEGYSVYEYHDGSNYKEIWYDDSYMNEDSLLIDTDYEDLDVWDGNNMNFRGKFNHGRLYPIVEINGEPVTGQYLFEQWSQWPGILNEGKIVDEEEAEKLRTEGE